ncbi:GGDEF domain-containing protein [Erythrobacter sp. SD-21]|uniref:GGDEF domain-containing protein n=1 Tax=Erythrobacter sp. SD-21 TaxID=161528 RepID=UPI000A0795D5|nr:GGDEF domain-containing protein [Erythrobacter sp. SD-21]
MVRDLLINRRVIRSTAIIAGILTAGSLFCTLIVMAFRPSDGEHVVLALSLAVAIPLVCAVPVALVVASQAEVLARLNRQLAYEASHDALTDLPNRREFFDEIGRRLESGGGGTVLLADVDRFKQVNDHHGHHTGDEALRALARLFAREIASDGLVARLGGEEFGVLIPDTSLARGHEVAERLRKTVEAQDFHSPEGNRFPLTISIGIDCLRERESAYPLRGADSALYAAKSEGRNRVSFYTPPKSGERGEKAA